MSNVDNDQIEQSRSDWALSLMRRGVIVKLTVARWRATSQLTPEMLGLKFIDDDVSKFAKKYLQLGTQRLFPKDVSKDLAALEAKARRNLAEFSFETEWGYFVPFTAFEAWSIANYETNQQYTEATKKIGSEYNNIIMRVKEEYKELARDVWARLYPDNKNGVTESFIESFSNKVIAQIPPVEKLISSFSYSSTYYAVPMLSFIDTIIAKTDDIEDRLERNIRQQISKEYMDRKDSLIDDFLDKTVIGLRSHIVATCGDVLQSLRRQMITDGDIPHRPTVKLQKMIKKVRFLDFYKDDKMASCLKDLEQKLGRNREDNNLNVVVDQLEQIIKVGSNPFIPKFN